MTQKERHGAARTIAWVAGLCLAQAIPLNSSALAYTPDSPVVQAMVERGITYLENLDPDRVAGGYTSPVGGTLLVAYTHYKVRQDPEHPIVRRGIETAEQLASDIERFLRTRPSGNYEASVAVLLLTDVDPLGYRDSIEKIADGLAANQKPHGGYGYPQEEIGDTSQSQYLVLAFWSLGQAGFGGYEKNLEAVARWFLRVQDPSGAWGYKGVDGGGSLVPQDNHQSHALTAAGAGSLLIAGDSFGLFGASLQARKSAIPGLPAALTPVVSRERSAEQSKATELKAQPILQAAERAERWLQQTPYRNSQHNWYFYYMYTLERYKSFAEVARGRQEREPAWYNALVEELRELQDADGAWGGIRHVNVNSPKSASTSLAILFLIRSTQKAIGDLSEGIAAGGQGLPQDTTNIRVEGTQIKGSPVAGAVTDLLDLLEAEDPANLEKGSIPDDLQLATDPDERVRQLRRLQGLVRGSQSWQARRVAARLLGQSDDLSVVPSLIFALGDPDATVRRFARDGLRFISRRFDGFGLPDSPSRDEVLRAQRQWRDWYRTLFPDYVFLEETF